MFCLLHSSPAFEDSFHNSKPLHTPSDQKLPESPLAWLAVVSMTETETGTHQYLSTHLRHDVHFLHLLELGSFPFVEIMWFDDLERDLILIEEAAPAT